MDGHDRGTRARAATPGGVSMYCGLCGQRITLDFDRVKIVHWEVVYRCQHCDSTSLIRREDAEAIDAASDRERLTT